MNVYAILRTLCDFVLEVGSDLGVEHQSINGDMSSSGVGLHGCCHEALREEEGRSPIAVHVGILNPFPEKGDPFDEIIDPRPKRL